MSFNLDKKLNIYKNMEIEPSKDLIEKTKLLIKTATKQKRVVKQVNWVPTLITTGLALVAIVFALFTFININGATALISNETAAIYSLDINPSIELGVNLEKEVIEVKSLNEDGKILLKEVNCIGIEVETCIDLLITKAVELGYIDETEANYIIVSEIRIKEDYNSMKEKINDIEKPESVNFVFLVGELKDKENADIKGISTGKEIFQEKAKEIGINIKDSELVTKSIKEVLNSSATEAVKIFNDNKTYKAPIIRTTSEQGYISVNWDKIEDSELQGYKIVISKNNAIPKYPEDGYLEYITDINQTSYSIDNTIKYHDGDFGGFLSNKEKYYISVTAMYNDKIMASNAILTEYKEKIIAPSPTPTAITYKASTIIGTRLEDGSITLSWDKISNEKFTGYKVVASATNPNPSYPNDGYIKYITNKNTTSINIGNDFSNKLIKGEQYYFSITVLYNNTKVPGNAVKLKYMEKDIIPTNSESTITGERLSNGNVILGWEKIDASNFNGYKVVASATNPNPSYPTDGYIRYITDRNTTSLLVDSSYSNKLTPGSEYYFSITVLYSDTKVAGNAIHLKYLDEQSQSNYTSTTIVGQRLENGNIQLTWDKIDKIGFDGYKVVASATNPNPSYPNDGYIRWITDKNTTSLLVDSSFSSLTPGTSYYFSITALYNGHSVKIAGNTIYLKYLDEQSSSSNTTSTITGERLSNGNVMLNWEKIDASNFNGYKVVASATNPNPSYPTDGYIRYITDRNTTSLLVDSSYSSKLTPGEEYYFSITVLYSDTKVAGNAIHLKYLDEQSSSSNTTSTITGERLSNGNVMLNWEKIDASNFNGYKVVASATNPNPSYPTDGYIRYITDRNTTSLLVDSSYSSKLTPGEEYYFSITVLYSDAKVAGNAIHLKYLDEQSQSEYPSTTIVGQRLENGNIQLTWDKIDETGFDGYKVVASATNPNPSYPDDGYIKWITDKNTISLLVDSSFSSLTPGTSYYFSITALYNGHSVKVAGNAIYLLFK